MRVLGIETSCDETAVAVYETGRGLLAHEIFSQVALHAPYGGVVPELASRDHLRKLPSLLRKVLPLRTDGAAGKPPVDAVAYTSGPGLVGALLVGAAVGRSLAYAWGVPAIGVHHMEAHLMAPLLEADPPQFPFLALLVSGGHTLLAEVDGLGQYRILGQSLDDAAGEAFDKTAKMLGLGLPGGPQLAKLAEQGRTGVFRFPRPLTEKPGLDFSFSGLKTAVVVALRGRELDDQTRADAARAFEEAIVDTLAIKCQRALEATGSQTLVVAGGVGANRRLRARVRALGDRLGVRVVYPRPEYCTDNAAMIALLGSLRLSGAGGGDDLAIRARARWPITELAPPV